MTEGVPESVSRLARIADALGRRTSARKAAVGKMAGLGSLPTLWLFTDPDRTPDPLAAATLLPTGSGVVLRTFGRRDVEAVAPALAALARRRRQVLLVGADEALASAIGADGLHLPERMLDRLPRLRAKRPTWRFTVAAHGALALRRAATGGADAAFLSPVLSSLSPSAGDALGPLRTAVLTKEAKIAIYGLGGVDAGTAAGLRNTGLAGLAGVSFARDGRFRT